MTASLIVPATLEEIIQRYDVSKEPFDEYHIGRELITARAALTDPSESDAAGAWAEVLAFALDTGGSNENPWNSYFRPMGARVFDDGKIAYSPDIAGTPPQTVPHWAARARSLQHPFLKARYADLAWDMSGLIGQRKRDLGDAQIAIDSYLDAIPRMAEAHYHLQFAIRALDLAVLINDKDRTDRARATLLDIHRRLMITNIGMWWQTVDRLLEDKKAGVTQEDRAGLVADLESIVARASTADDPTKFNPHEAQNAAEHLILYYRRRDQYDDVRRLHGVVGQSFEAFASNADPMLASALLQTATDEYGSAGLKDDRDRTRILMQQKITAAGATMKPIESKIEISPDDLEKFLDLVVVDDLATSFVRIGREFLMKRIMLEERVQKTLKVAPLMAHLSQMLMADNRVTAKIGSVGEDPFGRLVHETRVAFELIRPWLQQAFRRLFEKHPVLPEHFAGWATRHGLFEDVSLILEGVRAWERNDQVKAVHVLVPQIERGLRNIAHELGVPITKPHPKIPESSIAIGMGDILNNERVVEALGPDTTLHLQALYSDPRGMNLRNELAHGLMDAGEFYWHAGNLIVHSLLVLGLWKEFSRKPSTAPT